METTEAMVLLPPDAPLAVARPPEVVLEEARKAAAALKHVIDNKKKKLIFNGKTYLEYEDWQTVGRFYGVTARVREVKHVQYGDVQGFEAFAEAVLVGSGQVISAADSMCLNDETNWSRKPLFQLRSMAQTRACAKALRNVLAWVVVLAGYQPTPAEEMDGLQRQAAPVAPGPAPASALAAARVEFLDINISEVTSDIVATGKTKGNEYVWVKDGPVKSWPCFDSKLFHQLRGQRGENVRILLAQGHKGKYIVGIAPDPAEITDADLPPVLQEAP